MSLVDACAVRRAARGACSRRWPARCSPGWAWQQAQADAPAGQPGYLSLETQQLDDSTRVSLDPVSGNLLIGQRDLMTAPDTYNVTYERWYNSRNATQRDCSAA